MRSLLISFGKDERLCIFVIPLLVNTMFIIGLLPYLFGVPLMLWAWSLSIRFFQKPSRELGIGLAILAVALFYAHVVMYAVFGIGFAARFPWNKPERWLPSGATVAPSLLAVLWWISRSSQGQVSAAALSKDQGAHQAYLDSLRSIPQWTCDVFHDSSDELTF